MEQQIIVIVGPTCSGKTKLVLELAEELNSEIISADSRQIYKYLNIGTAKPNKEELAKVKHHFIDLLEPTENYNVGLFENDSLKIIDDLTKKNKIPIIVGGSGLYIKSIIDGIVDIDSDINLRKKLKEQKEKFGNEFIYAELKRIDPITAESMLPQNWKRVIRAIEVFHLTGKSILEVHRQQTRERKYTFCQFGINWKRETLYKNIEKRVDEMIALGLVKEVETIFKMGFTKELNSLNTVGYKEVISYLDNEVTLERAIELIKRNTRHYAKRQLTWFRKDERINWFDVESYSEFKNIKRQILNSVS